MNTPAYLPLQAPRTGMDRMYIGMREISATHHLDDVDSQDGMNQCLAEHAAVNYLAAQAAINGRKIKQEERREWAAAAVGVVWLIGSVATLLVAYAAYFWP